MNETMKSYVAAFAQHLAEAIKIGQHTQVANPPSFSNVIITGLGGSGIGGKIVSQLVAPSCPVPIYVNNDYTLPAFVGPSTLVIASSYSGNTEETLISVNQALKAGAFVYCITSGGKLAELANSQSLGLTLIPSGYPPRAAFGYGFPQLLYVLAAFQLIDSSFEHSLKEAIGMLEKQENQIQAEALQIAKSLYQKERVVIYAEADFEGVCIRFRQQLNENSKILCWHHILPEMNHNELVGWAGGNENTAVVLIQNDSDYYRTTERFVFSKAVFEKYTSSITALRSQGTDDLVRSLYIIHLTDWVSCYLADLRGVDAIEIDVINQLKSRLAEF
ncbi:MAG TPA: bifunctional phosphoglucose/phosphomannose isomerase [Luteibaculaceae bacterium]|nr:bifunctional phosphoglucose/phosphomannose isomerase [Luteibaculaceae bacterium]